MVDIDERVVQLKFDSSDFEAKTKATFSILDKLKEKLSFKDASDSENLQAITDNVQKMADKAYTIVDRMIDKIKDNIANKLLNFLSENTVGQISSAWSKYADMTTSVATLRAQGYAMEEINEQLSRLNYFTDETSYSFNAMVSEIGKFTSVGQKLEDATTAMMGIASWAALSGKNANEASRAMYQLSQAMGAGVMRMQDWKSIQTLNMATKEFKQNAIEAAIEAGTLKDNLNGTYTTLVGKKANKLSFTFSEFESALTEGAWFTSDVMMKVYSKYSEAVDDLRALYEEGGTKIANGVEYHITTTADALDYVRAKNEELYSKFDNTELKGQRTEINKLLARWKKIEKVTDETVDNYAEINNLTDKQKAEYRKNLEKDYATYLKEYSEIFKESEQNAEEALDDWAEYVSDFGLKAFGAGQEAKTFIEALEAAKDAASTVWTGIFTKIFGNYEEAKELWTDFANALYTIFVERLWNIDSVFEHWKEAGGRTSLWQGIYGFFGGIGEIIQGIRDGWDSLFEGDGIERGAQRLLRISQGIQVSGARFYLWVKELQQTDFFKNMAQALMNVIDIFRVLRNIVINVIKSFLPNGDTVTSVLVRISELIKNITARLIPTQKAAANIVRIIRGVISIYRILAKMVINLFNVVLPGGNTLWGLITKIAGKILDFLGAIGDIIYAIDNSVDSTNALSTVLSGLFVIIKKIVTFIKPALKIILGILSPVINAIKTLILSVGSTLKKVFTGQGIEGVETLGEKFKKLITKIKDAWNSVEGFKETFERFKSGTGVGNFLEMIGESFLNVARKIGNVILAVLGLESVLTEGKLHDKMSDFKDFLHNVFTVIQWIFTNVIVPVFRLLLSGIKNTLFEIGDAFRRGDLVAVLNYIKTIFTTIGSYGIVKLLLSVNKLLGSGGVLRIIRNIAKTFKNISKWFNAKALNERASAIQKLVVAIGLVLLMMYAISQIDDTTLERMVNAGWILLGIFVSLSGVLLVLSLVAQLAQGGIMSLALMFLSLSLMIGLTIKTIKEFGLTIEKLSSAQMYSIFASGGILYQIGTAIVGFMAVMAMIGRFGGEGLMGVGVTLIGFAGSLYLFALAMHKTIELFKENDFSTIAKAFLVLAAGVSVIALVMRLLTTSVNEITFFGKQKTKTVLTKSLSLALFTVVSIATFAFVLLPALETLSKQMDKFTEYCQGLMLFATMILVMATSLKMVTGVSWHSGINSLLSVLSFVIFVQYIVYALVPLIHDLSIIKWDAVKGGVIAFAATLLSIGLTIMFIGMGIRHILEGIAKINFKSIIAMLLGVAGIFLTISVMSSKIDSGTLSVGGIMASLGILLAVLVMLGGFILIINRSFRGQSKDSIRGTLKIVTELIGLVVAIGGLLVTGAVLSGLLIGDNTTIITSFASTAGALVAVITTVAIAFSLMVKSISNSMKTGNPINTLDILKQLLTFFLAISAVIVTMVGEAIVLTQMGVPWGAIIGIFATIFVGFSVMLAVLSKSMSKLIANITNTFFLLDSNGPNAISMMKTIALIVLAIFAGISGVMVAIGTTTSAGYEWMGALNLVMLAITFAVIMNSIGKSFKILLDSIKNAFTTTVKANNITKILYSIMAVILAVFAGIAGVLVAMQTTTTSGYEWMGAINIAVLAGAFFVIMSTIGKSFTLLIKAIKDNGVANSQQYKKYMAILITFGAVAAGVLLAIATAFEIMSNATANVSSGETILNAILMLGSFVVVIYTLTKSFTTIFNTVKRSGISNKEFAVIETVLGVILLTILELGYLISIVDGVELYGAWDIIPVVLGIIGIIAAISISVFALINTVKGITLQAQDVAVITSTLGTMLLTLVLFGSTILPEMQKLRPDNVDAILAACAGLSIILMSIATVIGILVIAFDKLLGTNAIRSVGLALLALYGTFFAIFTFGSSIVEFFAGFRSISAGDVAAALIAFGGLLAIIGIFSILIDAFNESSTKVDALIGIAEAIGILMGVFGTIQMFGESVVNFFHGFSQISLGDVIVALIAVGGLVTIASAIGYILGELNKTTVGFVSIGIAEFIALIFGIAWALDYAGPIIAGFFDMFSEIEDGAVWKGLLAIGGLAAVFGLLGSILMGFAGGAATFIAAIMGIALALEMLAGAIIALRIAFGDESYIDYAGRLADKLNGAFAKKEKIKSPSKKFEYYGKMIDLGLANGIDHNMKAVTKMASTLGIVTDEAFCDEVGIASPSKVFYENGRFIVAGLNNGINSKLGQLNNTGYDMGTNVAQGLEDGLADSDFWKGLFNGENMEDMFKKLLGGETFLDALAGENTTKTIDDLTEEERKKYEEELAKIEQNRTGEHGSRRFATTDEHRLIDEKYNKEIEELNKKYGIGITQKGGIAGLLEDSGNGMGDNFLSKITGFFSEGGSFSDLLGGSLGESFELSNLGEKIKEWLNSAFGFSFGEGEAGEGVASIGTMIQNSVGDVGNALTQTVSSISPNVEEGVGNAILQFLPSTLTDILRMFGIGDSTEYEKEAIRKNNELSDEEKEHGKREVTLVKKVTLDDEEYEMEIRAEDSEMASKYSSMLREIEKLNYKKENGTLAEGEAGELASLMKEARQYYRSYGYYIDKHDNPDAYYSAYYHYLTGAKISDELLSQLDEGAAKEFNLYYRWLQLVDPSRIDKEVYYNLADILDKYNTSSDDEKDKEKKKLLDFYNEYKNVINRFIRGSNDEDKAIIRDYIPDWLISDDVFNAIEDTSDSNDKTANNTAQTDKDLKDNTTKTTSSTIEAGTGVEGQVDETGGDIINSLLENAGKIIDAINNQNPNNKTPQNTPHNTESQVKAQIGTSAYNQIYEKIQQAGIDKYGKDVIPFSDIMKYVTMGFNEGWGDTWDENQKKWIFDIDKFILEVEKHLGIASPSEVFAKIAKYCVLGMVKGFDENEKQLLTTVGGLVDDVTDEADLVMPNSGPVLTPIIDDNYVKSRLNTMSSIGVNTNVDNVANSFYREIPDYSDRFTSLENAINNTNMLFSNLMELLQTGDVTTVNVEVKPVPDNIYNAVIATNHQRFRQTGRNGFLMV